MLFKPSSTISSSSFDLSSLAHLAKSIISNLGVKVDPALKLDAHVNTVIKSCFFLIRRLSKIKPFLLKSKLETVTHL